MSIGRYVIAGIKVAMDVKGELLKTRSEKYLCGFDGEPDMFITATEGKMDIMRRDAPSLNDSEREYIITSVLFYNKLLNFNGFMLHSSALSYDGQAYLFTADPGTGKSTHTELWSRYLGPSVEIINDDKPAVRLIDGRFYAIGTPWSGKTNKNADISVPIGGVALLYRSSESTIEPASAKEAVFSLLKQTVIPSHRDGTDLMSDLLDKFIRTVRIYKFGCDISEKAVITSFEAMTGKEYIRRA